MHRKSLSESMNRALRHVLIALALLLAQQASQLHALTHLVRDIHLAERGEKGAPPVGHPAAQCLAFHAIDSALHGLVPALDPARIPPPTAQYFVLPLPLLARVPFNSRAPPILS
jgi:hypothetical protein